MLTPPHEPHFWRFWVFFTRWYAEMWSFYICKLQCFCEMCLMHGILEKCHILAVKYIVFDDTVHWGGLWLIAGLKEYLISNLVISFKELQTHYQNKQCECESPEKLIDNNKCIENDEKPCETLWNLRVWRQSVQNPCKKQKNMNCEKKVQKTL